MEERHFILDTDIGPDCDDAAALGLAILYAGAQGRELDAVMHCTSSPYGVGTVRAIARWYGSSGLQVGTLKDPGFLSGEEAWEKYNKPLALSVGPEEREAGDAVKLYRKLMAGWPDGSVDIVAVGPLRNLGNLLLSGPDEFSPLSGRELAAAKVRRLTMMAGDFSEGCDRAEWNVEMDIPSARRLAREWPGEMVYCGFEVGKEVILLKEPNELDERNPVRRAYRLHTQGVGRPSWDPCTVQWAMGDSKPYTLSRAGIIRVDEKGVTHFTEDEKGRHYYLSLNAEPKAVAADLERILAQADRERTHD